jgi:hypothetical protein
LIHCSFPTISRAGNITGIVVTGAGGSGSPGTFGSGNLAEPALIYTDIAPLDLAIAVDAAGTYEISETPSFGSVHNTTGVAWSGFTWNLISGPSAAFIYSPLTPPFSSSDFSGTFAPATGTSTFATFSGGTLPNTGFTEPEFEFTASAAGTYTIEETPLAIPEPSSLVLAVFGIAGLAALDWGRRKVLTSRA